MQKSEFQGTSIPLNNPLQPERQGALISQMQFNQPNCYPNQGYEQQQQVLGGNILAEQGQLQPQTIFNKINITTESVLNFIKSKNPLKTRDVMEASLSNLTKINIKEYEEQKVNSILELDCQTIQKSKLNDITVLSIIQSPRQIEKGFFESSYTIYDIITEQFKWNVPRRYSDFHWLKDCLTALYPTEPIPQLPNKKLGNRRFEEDFIKKRMKRLQKFLTAILSSELFKSSEPLLLFLSCSDRVWFENQIKMQSPKSWTPNGINNLRSFKGKIKILKIDNNNYLSNNCYFTNISMYFKLQREIMEGMNKSWKSFYESMAWASVSLDEVYKYFQQWNAWNTRAGFSPTFCNMSEEYELFFKNWKRIVVNQTCVIKELVNNFFKDINKDSNSFHEVWEQQEELRGENLAKKTQLMIKKEAWWTTMNIGKWELNPIDAIDTVRIYRDKEYAWEKMWYQETRSLENEEILLGYYCYNISEKFKEMVEKMESEYIKNLEEFSEVFQPSLMDGINVWSEFTSSIKKI